MSNPYNPIKSVTPIDQYGNELGSAVTEIPVPSSYKYKLIDVSSSEAGRTEDMDMHKNRLGQTVRVDLGWVAQDLANGAIILNAFNAEYLKIEFLDTKAGGWIIKEFYVGDRDANLWNAYKGVWDSISFPIIQKTPDIV